MYKTKIININGIPTQVIETQQEQPQILYKEVNQQIQQQPQILYQDINSQNQIFLPQTQQQAPPQMTYMNQQNVNPQMIYTEEEVEEETTDELSILDESFSTDIKNKLNNVKFLLDTREIDYEQYLKISKKLVISDLDKNQ